MKPSYSVNGLDIRELTKERLSGSGKSLEMDESLPGVASHALPYASRAKSATKEYKWHLFDRNIYCIL